MRGKCGNVEHPTPAEIAERAAEVRERWSDDEHVRRGTHFATTSRTAGATKTQVDSQHWQPPSYITRDLL